MIGFNDEILMDSLAEIGWSLRLVIMSISFVDEDILLLLLLLPTVLRNVIPSGYILSVRKELDEMMRDDYTRQRIGPQNTAPSVTITNDYRAVSIKRRTMQKRNYTSS